MGKFLILLKTSFLSSLSWLVTVDRLSADSQRTLIQTSPPPHFLKRLLGAPQQMKQQAFSWGAWEAAQSAANWNSSMLQQALKDKDKTGACLRQGVVVVGESAVRKKASGKKDYRSRGKNFCEGPDYQTQGCSRAVRWSKEEKGRRGPSRRLLLSKEYQASYRFLAGQRSWKPTKLQLTKISGKQVQHRT